jgi:hypothetical protein
MRAHDGRHRTERPGQSGTTPPRRHTEKELPQPQEEEAFGFETLK